MGTPASVQVVRGHRGEPEAIESLPGTDPLRTADERGVTPWLLGTDSLIRLAARAPEFGWRVVDLTLRREGWRSLSQSERVIEGQLLAAVQRRDVAGALRIWATKGEHLFATRLELVDRARNWRVWLGRFGSAEIDARAGSEIDRLVAALLRTIEETSR